MEVESDSLKRSDSRASNIVDVPRKVADAGGDIVDLVGDLLRDTFDSYAIIRHNIDQCLLAAINRLKRTLNPRTKALQLDVHGVLRSTVGGVQKSFDDASEVVDRNLSLIVAPQNRDELSRPGSSSAYLQTSGNGSVGQGLPLIVGAHL